MKKFLALDVGTRRTGVAYGDTETGIPLPLDTVEHTSFDELEKAVLRIVEDRKIDEVIIGLPLLPSGEEGAQTRVVRDFVKRLQKAGIAHKFVDERYSTPRGKTGDSDAAAACQILSSILR